jgi:hypothetical protein
MLWVDPGMMWFDGAVNATHPEWRLKTNASVLKVNSPVWGNAWFADPSNPAYLEYLTDQLIAMHTTWAIDGVKLDFQPSLRENDKGWNYNISSTQVDYAYENAVLNGTSNLDIVLNCGGFAGLSVNPLQFYACNAFRIGPDANVWTGIKSAIQNYSVPYFLLTSGPNASELPLFDLDSVEPSFYWVYTNPVNEVKVRADLIYATGGLREISFAPLNNASFFATIQPMMNHNLIANDGRFVGGQTGTIHNNNPTVFGHFDGAFPNVYGSYVTFTMVNWAATSQTITVYTADARLIFDAPYHEYRDGGLVGDFTQETTLALNLAQLSSTLIVFTVSGFLTYPSNISSLVNLVFIMFAVGIVVGVVVEGTYSIRKNKLLSSQQMVKSLVNMVVYIIIGCAGVGILYSMVT